MKIIKKHEALFSVVRLFQEMDQLIRNWYNVCFPMPGIHPEQFMMHSMLQLNNTEKMKDVHTFREAEEMNKISRRSSSSSLSSSSSSSSSIVFYHGGNDGGKQDDDRNRKRSKKAMAGEQEER